MRSEDEISSRGLTYSVRTFAYREFFYHLIVPVASVVLSLIIGAIILLSFGLNPVAAYVALIQGSLIGPFNLVITILNAIPLIFTGLAVAFAFRCGLFNIGAEGQLYLGAIAAAWAGTTLILPGYIHLPLVIVIGSLAGGMWALLPGILKAKTGAHEVITTMMMSYIGVLLTSFLVRNILRDPATALPVSREVKPTAELITVDKLFFLSPGFGRLHIGFLLAILTALVVLYILKRTTMGYEIRAVGFNPYASEYGGISVARNVVLALFISGMLAGLAGTVEVLGVHHRFYDRFSSGYGFTGIAVALLAKNHPIGVIFAALLMGAIQAGGQKMQISANTPVDLIDVLQGVIIFLVAAEEIVKMIRRKKERKELADVV